MAFRFTARVMRQLGAELISSDDVALYELVKNGFDAGSSRVSIEIGYFIDIEGVRVITSALDPRFRTRTFSGAKCADALREAIETLASRTTGCFLLTSDQIEELLGRVSICTSIDDVIQIIRRINRITVADAGSGMSKDDVKQYFMTIGTTHRRRQHEAFIQEGTPYPSGSPVSGEKGIGRLSAMRLGDELVLETWQTDSRKIARLEIDWSWFEAHPDADLAGYDIEPTDHPRSSSHANSGTTLSITDLTTDWPKERVIDLVNSRVAKFIDPFDTNRSRRQRLTIRWNGEAIDLVGAARVYLDAAHNGMKGNVDIDSHGHLRIKIDYWFNNLPNGSRRVDISRVYTSANFSTISEQSLLLIGPFSFTLFHYNRKHLAAIPGVATRGEFKEWLDTWCGGLMVYRDGIRVLPYGQYPDDDWLGLDQRALRNKGFRVNRIQVVGGVQISRPKNPHLIDQTNREGLRDNRVSHAFQSLLVSLIDEYFIGLFREYVEKSTPDSADLLPRVDEAETSLTDNVELLIKAVDRGDRLGIVEARRAVLAALEEVKAIADELEKAVTNQQLHQLEVSELAAKGLSAEYLAHDLEAVLDASISDAGLIIREKLLDKRLLASLNHLTAVLKSTRVQVSAIKPGPATRRRRRSEVNVLAAVTEVLLLFEPRCERHGISISVNVRPTKGTLTAYLVEGHFRQILDNLMRNSIFWVLNSKELRNPPEPQISIDIDCRTRSLTIRDSGVGFAKDEINWIFVPFNTHRKGGYGLGLALAKELGEFNKMKICVNEEELNQWDRFTGITIDLSECVKN